MNDARSSRLRATAEVLADTTGLFPLTSAVPDRTVPDIGDQNDCCYRHCREVDVAWIFVSAADFRSLGYATSSLSLLQACPDADESQFFFFFFFLVLLCIVGRVRRRERNGIENGWGEGGT